MGAIRADACCAGVPSAGELTTTLVVIIIINLTSHFLCRPKMPSCRSCDARCRPSTPALRTP